jgi:RHS repeat-associated protein
VSVRRRASGRVHYNYFRDYDPAVGRYTKSDPIGLLGGINTYSYALNDPMALYDPYGLWVPPSPPQWLVDGAAGFGDTISFGITSRIRDAADIGSVDKCSTAYSAGEWTGIAYGFAAGGAAGWRAAGQKAAGKEFSHWIPNRMGGPRSLWNGNFVSPARHYLHDPFRFPRGWRELGEKWNPILQQLDRIPNVFKGAGAGGAAAGASAAMGDECGCKQ